jgi:hypothetical protein
MPECPTCSAETEPGQEYCLECGARVPMAPRGLAANIGRAWRRRLRWYPGDWLPVVLALLVIAALATAAAVYAGGEEDEAAPGRTIVATAPPDVTATETAAAPTETEPVASVPTEATPTVPRDGAGPSAPVEWPADQDGYTVVLSSLPVSGGRDLAMQTARRGIRAGLKEVGVLDSEDYASLHPGFYVVFAGVYGTLDESENAVGDARDAGFANAYAREITR